MDKGLLQYCSTDIEKKYLNEIIKKGTQEKAGESLGVSRNAIAKAVVRVKKRAAKMGYAPDHDMTKTVPDGFQVKGVSSYYGNGGELKGQWVKTDRDREVSLELLKEAVEGIIEPCKDIVKPTAPPKHTDDEFMACYPIADAHLGMYAWDKESGADYDVNICKRILTESMEELVDASPETETCLIANLADFFHCDSKENKTMRAGNILDVDTRWGRVVQVGVRAYFDMIRMALRKHKTVIIKSGIGNHDDHSIVWLATVMQYAFMSEPRVVIDIPINPYAYHTFGKNLLGITHHAKKPAELPVIMATDQPKLWGESLYRLWLSGHKHHEDVTEFTGCTVEMLKSISPNDAWGHAAGYRSGRSMECIIFKNTGGKHGRRIVNIDLRGV